MKKYVHAMNSKNPKITLCNKKVYKVLENMQGLTSIKKHVTCPFCAWKLVGMTYIKHQIDSPSAH